MTTIDRETLRKQAAENLTHVRMGGRTARQRFALVETAITIGVITPRELGLTAKKLRKFRDRLKIRRG